MAKLYTKTGDSGQTHLLDGSRVPKDDLRVAAYGHLDELNALLGFCRSAADVDSLRDRIEAIQNALFVLGAELADPRSGAGRDVLLPRVEEAEITRLENWIDESSENTGPLSNFVLPGGTELASRLHLARTCCRRAERGLVTLSREAGVRPQVLIYLNRLGDLLFAWAREANHRAGRSDITWEARRS